MKKVLIVTLILSLTLLLVACKSEKTPLEMVNESISYEEDALYVGGNDDMRIELKSIKGEVAPMLDGLKGEGKTRHAIKVDFRTSEAVPDTLELVLSRDSESLKVELTKDVLGMSFSASIDEGALTFAPLEVSLKAGDKDIKLDMQDVLKDSKMNSRDAVETAYKHIEKDIAQYFESGKPTFETQVKLINNRKVTDSPYFFYVAFIKNKDEYVACLIDPIKGEVVNKKVK